MDNGSYNRKRSRDRDPSESMSRKRAASESVDSRYEDEYVERGDFSIDVLDAGAPLTKIIHRRHGVFVVGIPKMEFQVRVKVHSSAWRHHRHDAFKATLYLDAQEVRSRYMMKP